MNRTLSLLAVAGLVAAPGGDAHACKLLGPIAHVVDPSLQETDHTPPTLPAVIPPAQIDYGDSSQDGCASDCENIASIRIPAVATDDMTAAGRIGYRFTAAAGELPPGLTLPDTAVEPNASDAVELLWNGTTGRPVDFTVEIVAIDLAGNESAPQSLRIMDDTSHACAVARGQTSRSGLAWMMLVALATSAALRRRRNA